MTAEEIARYNESLLCVPGEAARLRDLTRLRGRDVRWGVSVRRTSLRAKPTDALCPTRAGDRYDDALQLTAVLPNEPMALLGESADGRFCRVETSYFAGWVPAEDIGLCRDLEAWRTAQEGGFLRVTGNRVTLCCDPYEPRVSGAALPMGTSLPLAASPGTVRALRGRMSYDNYLVRLPVRRADRWLEYREAMVPVSADVCVGDLPYTHENVTAQAAKMRGEVYGWGGMLGGRDCSALVGDVYRCFGFRLPRDAAGLALLPGAAEGMRFYLVPSLDGIRENGLGATVTAAMNQAFFTLSLGIAAMEIFGSYMSDEHTLPGEAVRICVLDTFVALMAGTIIFPACFSFGVEPNDGPALIFRTLPNVFTNMAGGRLWGTLFFLFMIFASFSTVLAVLENILAICMDTFGWSRKKAAAVNCVLLLVLSLPCVFGYNIWSGLHLIGGRDVLDTEDFLVSNLLLPIGSLVYLLFCVSKWGWGFDRYLEEANKGGGLKLSRRLKPYFQWVLPVLILIILIQGLL